MKFKRLAALLLGGALTAGAAFTLSACADASEPFTPTPVTGVTSDSLYVKKTENLPDGFIMGMDASSVISLEKSGVKYYDYNGEEADVFKTLSENGINYIRVRVWNNPFDENGNGYGGGNCTIDTAVEIGKRATMYGMNLLVDFHYSDFWADPSKQMAPKAWQSMKIDEKSDALYEYTKQSLKKLKSNKVKVGMVQIGNETNGKFCGETRWNAICKLFNAGSKAVRDAMPKALVAIHFANPEKSDNYRQYAESLKDFYVDYDVFASSYYPYWHGTLDNLSSVLSEIAGKYDKKLWLQKPRMRSPRRTATSLQTRSATAGRLLKAIPSPYRVRRTASATSLLPSPTPKTESACSIGKEPGLR